MSQIIKLEKRFEVALEKLERALAEKNLSIQEKNMHRSNGKIGELLSKIDRLEKAAENDANEIEKLVKKLKVILET